MDLYVRIGENKCLKSGSIQRLATLTALMAMPWDTSIVISRINPKNIVVSYDLNSNISPLYFSPALAVGEIGLVEIGLVEIGLVEILQDG